MGLLHAGIGAATGVLADSWRDFFYCDALNEDTLVAKGEKRGSDKARSSNIHGESNIISDGSIISVNDGQCMIIVESGEIVDFCAEPGKFVYDRSTEPSMFYGDLEAGVMATFQQFLERLQFGGGTGKDQRIYYFNTKEIFGNKFGTSSPIPFRIVDEKLGLDLDTAVRCNGEYSYKIVDPILFYKNVCGNVEDVFKRDRIDSQLKSELLTALQPALAKISEMGIRYSAVPAHAGELADILNDVLSKDWAQRRGIKIAAFGINSLTLSEEDEAMIKKLQQGAVLQNQNMAAGYTAAAYGDAMRDAANNEGGAAIGMMGVGMANAMGGGAAAQLFAQGGGADPVATNTNMTAGGGFSTPMPGAAEAAESLQQQAEAEKAAAEAAAKAKAEAAARAAAEAAAAEQARLQAEADAALAAAQAKAEEARKIADEAAARAEALAAAAAAVPVAAVAAAPAAGWTCPECGTENTANFCGHCGTKKPEPEVPAEWTCPKCGKVNASNFCGDCGTARP